MQQKIKNTFKEIGALDLAHKVFLSLFLFNVLIWSGLFEKPLVQFMSPNLSKTVVALDSEDSKQQIFCESAKWHSRSSKSTVSFVRSSFVVFNAQSSQRLNSSLKSKQKNKFNSKKESASPFVFLNYGLDFCFKNLKFKTYNFVNTYSHSIYYTLGTLRGPPDLIA